MNVLNIKTQHQGGWLKKYGKNALADYKWFLSVIDGDTNLDDWVFNTPRKLGENTPDQMKKISKDRRGFNNPVSKTKPKYDIEELKSSAKRLFDIFLKDSSLRFNYIHKEMNRLYPDYLYNTPKNKTKVKRRGNNTVNKTMSFLLKISLDELRKIIDGRRGVFIGKGQKKSSKYKNMLRAGKEALRTNGRVTIPHLVLYEMILSIDNTAIKEYHVDYGDTWKSFDIYSPLYNTYIEMHGVIWHDPNKCPEKLLPVVSKNVINDNLKQELVKSMGGKLIVFWDDKMSSWSRQIKKVFNAKSISVEKAKSIVNNRRKRDRGI
jgi:hypothetical protein